MAAIVQRLERLIVVQDVVGSNPTSRPIKQSPVWSITFFSRVLPHDFLLKSLQHLYFDAWKTHNFVWF
jgi:hypothetical protein